VTRRARLVVFDLDGTLVDSSRDLASAVNATLARVAPRSPPLPEKAVRTFIGNGARNLVARSLAAVNLPQSPEEVMPVFLEEYARVLLETTRPYPGVVETLDALRDRSLAVLTNKPGDLSRALLDGLGLGARFFRVLGGGDGPARKPDPAGLRLLMEDAKVKAGETVLVGDSAVDVRTGRAAGVLTVGVTYGFDRESFQGDPPDLLLPKIDDLPPLLDPSAV
jgi:phosphoglycolate phosphatase